MTQPVFDLDCVEEMHRRTQHLGVAIFTGVRPLLSSRQAEFLHHEAPGIIVSELVRAELAALDEKPARALRHASGRESYYRCFGKDFRAST